MQNNLKVSIITPSFNQGRFLEQTILSVLNQNYDNIEYMVVDGASTDASLEIIQKYADKLTWWVSERDSGQPEAVNKGWAKAGGEIIGWLNSDDLLLPETVSRFVKAFEEHPEAGIVFGDAYSIDAEGEIFNLMTFGDWGLKNLMVFDIICQPAVLIRREILEKAGYLEEDLHFLMDHHLWLRLAKLAPMVYLPGPAAAAPISCASEKCCCRSRFWRGSLPSGELGCKIKPIWLVSFRKNQPASGRVLTG